MGTNVITICPYCGSDNVDGNYNYDTANVEYECNFCGETFTDKDLVYCEKCGVQLMYDNVYHNDEGDTICQVCSITNN
jgi:transposase-like protein